MQVCQVICFLLWSLVNVWYPPCHYQYCNVNVRDKGYFWPPEIPCTYCQSSCSESLDNYPNGIKERVKKVNQRGSHPIHEKMFSSTVVLCLSGNTWLAVAKGLTYSVTTQHWDLLHPMPSSHPLQCLQWHARDPLLRLAAPSHWITSAILTPASIMH